MLNTNFKLKEDESTNNVLINIFIPEKSVERNIEWNLNDTVDSLKYYVLKLIPDLDDPLNYGFFLPASNGKNGKFLQEERILNHYLIDAPYKLELRRKIRMYYSNIPNLKKVNNKSFHKQFVLHIRHGELMKINKLLNNGLDPNFHVQGLPETPLTLACRLQDPHKIIMALVSNGAYLDFRASDSMTALHKVAKEGLHQPMKTLLQLGQSPNCKDNKGYTPLYYCIENDAPPDCVNLLLYEHSIMGIRDDQGFQEIHKACLYGRTVHLDHLLTYGADIDAKTNKGNTALHICALHNQGSCARLLLYRGITRYALDFENKSAYQTALLSNNLEIADLIQNFKDEDVVPVTSLPKYNEKRRSILPFIKRFSSASKLDEENDDPRSSFNESGVITTSGNYNGSMQSLPIGGLSVSPPKSNSKLRSQYPDSQSLKNFPKPSTTNSTQLNTWSSPAYNMKSNPKARIPIASIISSQLENMPRTIVLQRGPHGFGFVIRGIKNDCEIVPKMNIYATQYFECVAENSPAFYSGLLAGDYLLEVNNIDVHEMSHENVVKIIQMAGDCLTLKVITVNSMTASTGIFDNNSETKSNSDSQSLISESSVSIGPITSDNMIETEPELSKHVNNSKLKSDVFIKNIQPSVSNEIPKSYCISTELKNSQDNLDLVGLKKSKFKAPPPPTRNNNTLLSINQNNNDHTMNHSEGLTIQQPRHIPPKIISERPISMRNNYTVESVTMNQSKPYIPPPDYISDSDIGSKSLAKKHLSVIGNSVESSALLPPPPPPPPPPLPVAFSSNNSKSAGSFPIVHAHLNLDKELSAVSLKHVSQSISSSANNDSNPALNDHSEALKFAVLNHRRKIEDGESHPDNIDEKLKENKVGHKSLIFEAALSPNNENKKQTITANCTTKSFDFVENKHTPIIPAKNPATYPKPNTQIFTSTNSTKVYSNAVSPMSTKPNANENVSDKNEINLRLKAENLRSNLLKKEQEHKKGTLYFTTEK